ncbi:hypothetical protein [Psychrosphaera aestuarii]|uniref:hypothetical protein n=1 Tax=Psychrosphaera aestuarii TaxID=1266052 RepID=UPI001B32C0A9|nr:hypothetical protein [Psychrosphaera aestuarii]
MTEQISLCLSKARPSYAGLGVKALNMRYEYKLLILERQYDESNNRSYWTW